MPAKKNSNKVTEPAQEIDGSNDAVKKKGRPKWMPDLAEVERLAKLGLNNDQIAHALSISPSTLYLHKKEFSEFSEAIARGSAKGNATISNALYEKAIGGDTNAMIFYLRAKGGWIDKATVLEKHSTTNALILNDERLKSAGYHHVMQSMEVQKSRQLATEEVFRILGLELNP